VQNRGVPTPAFTAFTATVVSPVGTTSSPPVEGASAAPASAAAEAVAAASSAAAASAVAVALSLTPLNVRNASWSPPLRPDAPPPLSLPQATAKTRSRLNEAKMTQGLLIGIFANVSSLSSALLAEPGPVHDGRRVGLHVNRSTTAFGTI
jgi:hypothetical protein